MTQVAAIKITMGGKVMEHGLQNIRRENNLAIWAERVKECKSSGRRVTEWCEENGIKPNTYYRWQKKVYEAVSAECNRFYEIPLAASTSARTAVSIEINGITADIRCGADAETIFAALTALKRC